MSFRSRLGAEVPFGELEVQPFRPGYGLGLSGRAFSSVMPSTNPVMFHISVSVGFEPAYPSGTGYEIFNWWQQMLTVGRPLEWPRLITVGAASGLTLLFTSHRMFPFSRSQSLTPA